MDRTTGTREEVRAPTMEATANKATALPPTRRVTNAQGVDITEGCAPTADDP